MNPRRINPVQRSLSRPLTILGAERKLFFFAMCMGAATFNLLGSLLGGVLIFLLLYSMARWASKTDPQILKLLLASAKSRREYDPLKFTPISIRRVTRA
jgi:type IV secretory pathway TrbD component